MIYAARADLEARFGADEIARLADTGDDGAARMDAALAEAAAAIEAMLREAFEAPLPDGSYPLLTAVACDLARERLYDDKAPEAVTARAELARASLTDIATDQTALIDAAGEVIRPRHASARAGGPAPAMTPENLQGL